MVDITLSNLILYIGVLKMLSMAYETTIFVKHHFLTSGYDLIERYGKDSWAVITGSSDGIGAEYAKTLARKGFNIILISRTKSKLEKVEADIKKESPDIETKIVIADFSGDASLAFYRNLLDLVKDLDVSIVIANAGLMNIGAIETMKDGWLQSMLDVNIYHYIMMHKVFLPKLMSRVKSGKNCALIGLSSAAYLRYFPTGMNTYAATKAFTTYMSRGLSDEIKDLAN